MDIRESNSLSWNLAYHIGKGTATLELAKEYIEKGARVDCVDYRGHNRGHDEISLRTLIMVACHYIGYAKDKYEYFLIIKFLLESGTDANETSYHYERHEWSSWNKSYTYCALTFIIDEIFSNYVSLDGGCGVSDYPTLDLSEIYNNENNMLNILKLLLEYGANLDYVDKNFFTFSNDYQQLKFNLLFNFIKDMARGAELINSVKSGDLEKVKQCIIWQKAVKYSGLYNKTAIMWACQKGNFEVALMLISAGADINAKDTNGKTVLNYAADGGNAEIMKILLAQGADTGAKK